MREKKEIPYVVDREFLSKISVEELLVRIIKSHLKEKAYDGYEDSEHI